MPRRSYSGGATPTTITGAIDSSVLSFSIADASGWPTGAIGNFTVVLDKATASEEKVECSDLTGTTVTVSVRGFDGGTAASHAASATAEVALAAIEMNETNKHAFDVTNDDHTQYLNTTRHAAIQHSTAMIADGAITQSKLFKPAVGTPELLPDAVDSTKIADLAVGNEHLQTDAVTELKIQDNSVTSAKIGDGEVKEAEIGAGAVTNAKLGADAVTTDKILDGTILAADHEAKLQHVVVGTPLPTGTTAGETFYENVTHRLWIYNGTTWDLVGGKLPYVDGSWAAGFQSIPGGAGGIWTRFDMAAGTPTFTESDAFTDIANDRFNIPTGLAGRYLYESGCSWETELSDKRRLRIFTNNGELFAQQDIAGQANLTPTRHFISRTITLAEGDWITTQCAQNTGAALIISEMYQNLVYLGPV